MRLDDLTIALRTRTPWEAADLGFALVRTHATRIYTAWMLITLPLFALLNLAGGLIGWLWIAPLAMWWLKPVFDRIPIYIISRAVFGSVPSHRDVMRAQRDWGWRGVAPWLLWRRFHPGRAMLLPVDLLEAPSGAQRRMRVRVLARAGSSPNVMLTFVGVNLEIVLGAALVLLGLMFVPVEFLTDSAKAVWRAVAENPPWWAQVLLNLIAWIAMAAIEPFYAGAGFGLYLNRRIQLEGWDIELAFRTMAARLSPPLASAALLVVCMIAYAMPLQAAPAPVDDPKTVEGDTGELHASLRTLFGDGYRDDGKPFEEAVVEAYGKDDLSPKRKAFIWKRRIQDESKPESTDAPAWALAAGKVFGFIVQYGLWILLAIALVFTAIHHRRWLPWISDRLADRRVPDAVELGDVPVEESLPGDLPAAVRALMRASLAREAMALMYRAAVARLAESLGTPLPPGATESDCLRHARRLRDAPYEILFARIVRGWQAAAYAQTLPTLGEVEAILTAWSAPPRAAP